MIPLGMLIPFALFRQHVLPDPQCQRISGRLKKKQKKHNIYLFFTLLYYLPINMAAAQGKSHKRLKQTGSWKEQPANVTT
jgi:hypothetical protein